jgi:two-component system KDP operon response regulator KdpE
MRIVIIEDEEELGMLMGNYLKKRLFNQSPGSITIAKNLKDGLSFIKEIKPEWVILDNNLPDGKGIHALEIIRKLGGKTQILMMSAMTNIRDEALRNGADYFLGKPISFTEINKIITRQS